MKRQIPATVIPYLLKKQCKAFLSACAGLFFFGTASFAQGSWTPVQNLSNGYNHGVMLVLTDGTVIVKTSGGGNDDIGTAWDKLTPDVHGSYANGTWTPIGQMAHSRLYFSSQVLQNGTVYVAGGEYGDGRTLGEIYYPQPDIWIDVPALPTIADTISDANSEILPNGKVLQAIVSTNGYATDKICIYDPVNNTYAAGPHTLGIANESAWLKLPDNSILYVDINSTNAERYMPATNTWIHDGTVPVDLYDPYGYETGAAFLLPDGRGFFIGSSGKTAYYTPSGSTAHGTWAAGPVIPDSLGAPDAAAAMMVNGKILCAFSPIPVLDTVFKSPMYFYEFDYLTNTFTQITAPDGSDNFDVPSYLSNMVCLPDGSILYGTQGDDQYYVYTPGSAPLAAGKPVITNVFKNACDTMLITGTRFNGITEGAAYGDDWQMSTNYPIVRLKRNDSVFYATTYHWNSTGVMRGASLDSVQVVLADTTMKGSFMLEVVANGNPSVAVPFTMCDPADVKNVAKVNSNISIHPNPASKMATVTFNSKDGGAYSLKMMDVYGRVIKETNEVAVRGENNYTLQLDGLAKGMYSIVVTDGKGAYSTKLIIK